MRQVHVFARPPFTAAYNRSLFPRDPGEGVKAHRHRGGELLNLLRPLGPSETSWTFWDLLTPLDPSETSWTF